MITPSSFLRDLSTLDDAQKYGKKRYKNPCCYFYLDPFMATINRNSNSNQNSNAYSNPAFSKYGWNQYLFVQFFLK